MARYIKFRDLYIGTDYTGKDTDFYFNEFNPNEGSVSRSEDKPIGCHGIHISNATYDARVINVKGTIVGTSLSNLYDNMNKLSVACDGLTAAQLTWCNGTKLYASDDVVADLPSYGLIEGTTVDYNVNFTLPHFFWYESNSMYSWLSYNTAKTYTFINLNDVFTDTMAETQIQIKEAFTGTKKFNVSFSGAATNGKLYSMTFNVNGAALNDYIIIKSDTNRLYKAANYGSGSALNLTVTSGSAKASDMYLRKGNNMVTVTVDDGVNYRACVIWKPRRAAV